MLSYCLKCKKNTESIDQNVLYVVPKNQTLLKNKKQKDY